MIPDPYPVRPFSGPVDGVVRCPGSKSITNRALVLAALSDRTVTLTGALFSRDTEIMIAALRAVGLDIRPDPGGETIRVRGCGGRLPRDRARIHVGNSGTSARFLSAFLCLAPDGVFDIDGDDAMYRRPMRGVLDALARAGWAEVEYHREPGHVPFTLKTRGPQAGTLEVDPSESSQMLSALLMVAPAAPGPVVLRTGGRPFRRSYVDLTCRMLRQFGAAPPGPPSDADAHALVFEHPSGFTDAPAAYAIEPDASAASYFLALPLAVGGTVRLRGFPRESGLQGDLGFISVLRNTGLEVETREDAIHASFSPGRRVVGVDTDFFEISDTFLTYAALAPLFENPVTLSGIAHTRRQETDRVAGAARELRKLGQIVEETGDSLYVVPQIDGLKQLAEKRESVLIDTYEDHRFAMSFAILGVSNRVHTRNAWLSIADPLCCAKTFPAFFERLESLRP